LYRFPPSEKEPPMTRAALHVAESYMEEQGALFKVPTTDDFTTVRQTITDSITQWHLAETERRKAQDEATILGQAEAKCGIVNDVVLTFRYNRDIAHGDTIVAQLPGLLGETDGKPTRGPYTHCFPRGAWNTEKKTLTLKHTGEEAVVALSLVEITLPGLVMLPPWGISVRDAFNFTIKTNAVAGSSAVSALCTQVIPPNEDYDPEKPWDFEIPQTKTSSPNTASAHSPKDSALNSPKGEDDDEEWETDSEDARENREHSDTQWETDSEDDDLTDSEDADAVTFCLDAVGDGQRGWHGRTPQPWRRHHMVWSSQREAGANLHPGGF